MPPEIIVVPAVKLLELARLRPVDPKPAYPRLDGTGIDAREFIERHRLEVVREKPWNGAVVFELEGCPFNPEHFRSSSIIQFPSGGFVLRLLP